MSQPKSKTAQAMQYKRDAYTERLCKPNPVLAEPFERRAADLLKLDAPPNVETGGELVEQRTLGDMSARVYVRDTLAQGATQIAADASIRRTDLLMQPSFDVVALAVDAADSIGAENSIEKMLAHQMAVAHEAALRMMDRALSYEHKRGGDQVEACRCINAAARLMSAFQDGVLTLQRLRTGGKQTVTVQHVNVEAGAQAVIGNVQTGGRKRRGSNGKQR